MHLAQRRRRPVAVWASCLMSLVLVLAGCTATVSGSGSLGDAPDAHLTVQGTDNGRFDQLVENALSDIMAFWKVEFPKISGGKPLTPLGGGLYSIDGLQVAETGKLTGPARSNACAQQDIGFVVDNGAFCSSDDSIAWDRAPTHLFARLADRYGPFMVALIFAHEFGHAISYRLGVFSRPGVSTIDRESQADCAAGAWAASALKGQDPHFRTVTQTTLDDALEGFLDGRDATPDTDQDISHGDGFDRLSAVADGIDKGASYCFSPGYFASRTFTERPFYANEPAQENAPLSQILATGSDVAKDLNRFWSAAAPEVHRSFANAAIKEADHPACGATSDSEFGYCPDDNTVYYSASFAHSAYYSIPAVTFDKTTGNVTLVNNQAGDFALVVLFAVGWGLAVRHQLFDGSTTDAAALNAAICYSGAYAKDINVPPGSGGGNLVSLSPGDLDEATSAMLDQVGSPQAFGARGTSGLDRIQDFVRGYKGGLPAC